MSNRITNFLNGAVSNFMSYGSSTLGAIGSTLTTGVSSVAGAVSGLFQSFHDATNQPTPEELQTPTLPLKEMLVLLSLHNAAGIDMDKNDRAVNAIAREHLSGHGNLKTLFYKENPPLSIWQEFKVALTFWLLTTFSTIIDTAVAYAVAYTEHYGKELEKAARLDLHSEDPKNLLKVNLVPEKVKGVNCVVRTIANRIIRSLAPIEPPPIPKRPEGSDTLRDALITAGGFSGLPGIT